MCVCVCVCIFCIVTLEPLSTLCVSFSLFFIYFFKLFDNISISMYIICVIPCLFRALSQRVGVLQTSLIICYQSFYFERFYLLEETFFFFFFFWMATPLLYHRLSCTQIRLLFPQLSSHPHPPPPPPPALHHPLLFFSLFSCS